MFQVVHPPLPVYSVNNTVISVMFNISNGTPLPVKCCFDCFTFRGYVPHSLIIVLLMLGSIFQVVRTPLPVECCVDCFMWYVPHSLLSVVLTVSSFMWCIPHSLFIVLLIICWIFHVVCTTQGSRIAQWLEHQTHDWKVTGSNPCRSSRRIFFSKVNFLCWILFWYPFHPHVTTAAYERSLSFCQKCRWQVTAKHAYTLRTWLCMKSHGAWLYGVHRTCAKMAAISCGTSHASTVSTPLRWILKKRS